MSYTAAEFIKAIPGSAGIISTIARRVGCDWHTAKRYVTEYATVKQAYEDERAKVVDLAETKVIEAINDGDISTVRWYLSTIGKDRGYTERSEHEVSGKGGEPIVMTFSGNIDPNEL